MSVKQAIRILMVDGDPDDIFSLKEALIIAQIINVEVQEVEDGEQALAYLGQEYPYLSAPCPHLIFVGMNLPGITGPEFLAEIKDHVRFKHIPVAVLTTATDSQCIGNQDELFSQCYVFKKPTSSDQWIYVLRCVEEVWCSIKNMSGHLPLPR